MAMYEDSEYKFDFDYKFEFNISKEIPDWASWIKFEYFDLDGENLGKITFLNKDKTNFDVFIVSKEIFIRQIEEAYMRIFTHS